MNVENVSRHFGERIILDQVSLGINEGDKVGVIGLNGTGKSTLLKIMAGIEDPDEGNVIKGNKVSVAYLPQNPVFSEDDTILGYVCGGKQYEDGRSVESEARTILNRLGIVRQHEPIKNLSGGQKKRVALAAALIVPADVIIMDEPTNHLDNDMVIWLENFLTGFKGQVIMVTHDRYFLDKVTNKIVELDRGKLYTYNTNYSGFLEAKAEREEIAAATEKKRQNILRTELAWIRRGCQARSTKQQARIDRFEDMREASRKARSELIKNNLEISSISTRIGKKTVELHEISKSYGTRVLFSDFTHIVLRDERIGFIGPNGCGKSTLLKIICGLVEPDSGSVEIGDTIKIGFFMQENEILDESINVIEHVKNIGEYVATTEGRITASQMCERFLFTPSMQYTPIKKLSGGEKRRLNLLSVLMEAPNVLVLDEPTNDLDIGTLEILEDYIDHFAGMVIVVSHDRFFLDRIVDRIFAFEDNGRIVQYEGGYTDYYEKSRAKAQTPQQTIQEPVKEKNLKNVKTREEKLKLSYNEQKEYESIDADIAALEEQIADCDRQMAEAVTQYTRLTELATQKEKLEGALEEKMERWVYLNELVEQIEAAKLRK
jgi:ATP-binding cassette subfamily F protein uup